MPSTQLCLRAPTIRFVKAILESDDRLAELSFASSRTRIWSVVRPEFLLLLTRCVSQQSSRTKLSLCWSDEWENVMVKCGVIGAMAISLAVALATTAVAGEAHQSPASHYKRHHANAGAVRSSFAAEPNLPVENALRWGYSQGYSYYPSGWGGLYGDGRYPGNTVSNRNYPTW
jgi:hypothetical protein